MKEKLKKAKGYVKEHKKEILIGTGVAILGCIGLSKVVKTGGTIRTRSVTYNNFIPTTTKIDSSGIIGDVGDALMYGRGTSHEFWIDGLTLDKLGELGESIKKSVPTIPEDDGVWLLMDVYDKSTIRKD